MSTWQLHLFGPPRLLRNETPVEIGQRKVLALFVYLAATKQPHSRDALATLFWPDQGQREARATLRRTLYRLQEALRAELLDVSGDRIALHPAAALWSDLDAFQQATAQALAAETDPGSPATLAALTQAATLYVDDFLAGFTLPDAPAFDDWQFFEREALRQQFATVLQRLTQFHCEGQEWEEAISYARRWLALDPLHEPAQRTLMQIYAWAGQSAAALRQYQECVQLLNQELGVEPEAETVALYESIRTRRFPAPVQGSKAGVTNDKMTDDKAKATDKQSKIQNHKSTIESPSPRHNLPPQSTPFIGRDQEVANILDRLQEPTCRLLTLVGPGGMGKTRLALRVAQHLVEHRPPLPEIADGLFFVALAAVSDADAMLAAIADAVGLRFTGAQTPRQQLIDYLHNKTLVLVLDNFEQLLARGEQGAPQDDGGQIVAALLAHAAGLKLLVTSREALNLQEEWFHPIAGLDFPRVNAEQVERVERYDAVRLFEQCARRARMTFSLAAEEQGVVRICQLVEGMPLALELAAAWLKVLSVEKIAAEIEHNLDLLVTRHQNLPERQRSLRIIFEQTWRRLSLAEQHLLSALSVFQGSFTLEAAEQVTGGTVALIGDLVDKALLHRKEQAPIATQETSRFHFHPLLQQFAQEKLQTTPTVLVQIKTAHASYYLDFLEKSSQFLNSADRKQTLTCLETDFANITAGWRWVLEMGDFHALSRFALPLSAIFVNQAQEGVRLFAQAAAVVESAKPTHPAALRAILIAQAEQMLHLAIDLERCIQLLEQALNLFGPADASPAKLKALNLLGMAIWLQGDHHQAKVLLEQGLAVARQQGALAVIGDLLIRSALVEREISDPPRVMAFYHNTLRELRALGDPVNLAHQLLIYGEYLINQGQIQQGQHSLRESLALAQASGGTDFHPFILLHLGVAAYKLGEYAQAEHYWQEIVTSSRAEERVHPQALAQLFLGRVKLAQNALEAAERHLQLGLKLGWMNKLTLVLTLGLVCLAELYDRRQEPWRAVYLLTIALHHPATEERDKQAAHRHLQALQTQMPAAKFGQAVEQGRRSGLEAAVSQILLELHP